MRNLKYVSGFHRRLAAGIALAEVAVGAFGRAMDAVRAALWEMNPRVAVLPEGERAIGLNPQLLMPDQPPLVLAAVREAILATQ